MRGEVEMGEGSSSSLQRTETMIVRFQRRLRMIVFVLLFSWSLWPVRIPSLDEVVDNDDDHDHGGASVRADDSDIEAGSAPCCRICLESDVEDDDELISPCMCKGTLQFVHRSCLDHWRSVKEGFDFSHCTTCKAQFHLRIESSENSWHKIKFRLFVTRDVLLVFLAVQTAEAASLLHKCPHLPDKRRKKTLIGGLFGLWIWMRILAIAASGAYAYFTKMFNNQYWDHILSKHPIPFYYCAGAVMLSTAFGLCGLTLHCFKLNRKHPGIGYCQCCSCGCSCGFGTFGCCYAPMKGCCTVAIIAWFIIFGFLGIAYGLFAFTMLLQRLWQKHYHIITKRELTKQYIVEDLHGCYNPPKLDSKHEEQLKMLKLF